MKNLQDIMRDFVIRVLGEQEFYSERARVTEIDVEAQTCTVETVDGKSEILSVIIQAYRGAKFGVFPLPKIGSVVTVAYYDRNEAYIAKMGELDGLKLVYNDTDEAKGITIDATGEKLFISWPNSEEEESTTIEVSELEIIFNGGNLLGLVKIEEMTARLNDLEALWNKLQMDFNSWVPVVQDGGLALKTQLLSSFLLELVPDSTVEDFENEKIKQ